MNSRIAMYKGLGAYGTLGLEIAVSFVVALLFGEWLDTKFNASPWFTILLCCLAVASCVKAIRRAIVMMREVNEQEERLYGNPEPLFDERPKDSDRNDAPQDATNDETGGASPTNEPKAHD